MDKQKMTERIMKMLEGSETKLVRRVYFIVLGMTGMVVQDGN